MPVRVKLVEWDPGMPIPLHELDGEMYGIPVVDAPYGRGTAMRMREIEHGDPVRLHFVGEIEREHELLGGLPQGHVLDCGRNSETGGGTQWSTPQMGGSSQRRPARTAIPSSAEPRP